MRGNGHGSVLLASKSFATLSGRIISRAKASRRRREGLFHKQKLRDIVGKDYFASKSFLTSSVKIISQAKIPPKRKKAFVCEQK